MITVNSNNPGFRLYNSNRFYAFISLLILFFCSVFTSNAQNLVPNPSFEQYDTCPNWQNQVKYAISWSSNGNSTPDYYNACSINYSVPFNSAGFQDAATGDAYCGLYTFWFPNPSYREYIGTVLSQNLFIGEKYFISFYVNLANSTTCATNKIGILFSTIQYYFDYATPSYKNFSNLFSVNIIYDTLNWVKISGSFIADSAYKYLSIGNFFDNNNTDTSIFSGSNCVAYYYIDDICVSNDSLTCNNPFGLETNILNYEINIYPNPVNNTLIINCTENNFVPDSYEIYDIYGRLLIEKINTEMQTKIDISNLSNGIYFLKIKINRKYLYKTIILNKF